jgi:ribosomal-protein-alanine N-acetyltransferase
MKTQVYLRKPAPDDEPAFLAAVRRSRELHHPWVQPPATAARFRLYLERTTAADHCSWFVCRRATHELAGVINLGHIVLGPLRSCYVGYYAFAGCERQGLMCEGLTAAVRHAFGKLKLHRLEANIQPGNAASIALARACGFQLEGYSPKYLKILGRWRDHERWAILATS